MKQLLFLCCITTSMCLVGMEERITLPNAEVMKQRLKTLPKNVEFFIENSGLPQLLGNKTLDQSRIEEIVDFSVNQHIDLSPFQKEKFFLSVAKSEVTKALLTPRIDESMPPDAQEKS